MITALLCFKWAQQGVSEGIERYILGALIATQCLTGIAYMRRGIPGPPAAYFTASLLMAIAAWKQT